MEKPKRIEADFQLPEAIIHHIQSFFNGNEAAQTTILSRSWYQAWLTRPNLDFDQKHFANKSDDDFWEFAIKTVERYEKLNLNIDSLRLWIDAEHSLATDLIIKALKLGATSLDFKIYNPTTEFALPHQVFGFENLTRLSVNGCKIGADNGMLISCSRLKSLALEQVYPQGNIIWKLISSCPFIENLLLNSCESIEFGKQNVVDNGPILVNEFRNLKRLYLSGVLVHNLFSGDFSSKFPILEDLDLGGCEGCTDIEISSPSLECIDFTSSYGRPITRVKLDVPNIRKFSFSGTGIPPLLLFETIPTSEWESFIFIERESAPSATWFLALSRLLKKLSPSRVTLHLDVWSEKPSGCTGELRGVRDKPEVDWLTVNGPYSCFPAFYYSLFKYCRPIYIDPIWDPRGLSKHDDSMEFVMKRKMQQVCLDSCIAYQSMSERDLKKVKIEFNDDSVSDSECPFRIDATSTSLGTIDDEQEIEFYLKWEEED